MNLNAKPYRLINPNELMMLQEKFERIIQLWNDKHALLPLSCVLSHALTPVSTHECTLLLDGANAQALLLNSDYAIIKHSLFDDASDAFNAISQTLLMVLINELLGTTSLTQQSCPPSANKEWFYTGAPTLALILTNSTNGTCLHPNITLYLHPQWVLCALPKNHNSKIKPIAIHKAIDTKKIDLQVALIPVPLPLKSMLNLRVGDVIKTDHPLTAPLHLNHQQQTVCHVDIGITNAYKSIQITRPS